MAEVTIKHIDEVANFDELVASFSCGNEPIDNFLKNEAISLENVTNTFIVYFPNKIVGFVTLQNNSTPINRRYRKDHKFDVNSIDVYPSLLISYFAIDKDYQHKEIGKALMIGILGVVYNCRRLLGAYTLLTVESLEDKVGFYKQFGFLPYQKPSRKKNIYLGITVPEIKIFLENQAS